MLAAVCRLALASALWVVVWVPVWVPVWVSVEGVAGLAPAWVIVWDNSLDSV